MTPVCGFCELADGRCVEAGGPVGFDAAEAPRPGEKAFLMVDENGQVLRWEPYPAGRRVRRTDSGWASEATIEYRCIRERAIGRADLNQATSRRALRSAILTTALHMRWRAAPAATEPDGA